MKRLGLLALGRNGKMWLRQVVVFGAVLAVGLTAGCGSSGPSAEEKQEAKKQRERAEEKKATAIALERRRECEGQLSDFLEALEELDGRLQVGLSYSEYSQELGTIQVAYNRIPINGLDPICLGKVGVPSEKAFQEFAAAGEAWNECIEELSCEDGISPEVQSEWSKGSSKLERATGLGISEVGAPSAADYIAVAKRGAP